MKRILKILGLTIVIGAGALWASAGAHRGWTQTSVPEKTLDEVTGIEGITYQRAMDGCCEASGDNVRSEGTKEC